MNDNNKIIVKSIGLVSNTIKAEISIKGNLEIVETQISENMLPYVCLDRSDAYVVGFLYTALQLGLDFESAIPMSEELYYNLEYHFIDAMVSGDKKLNRINLNIPTISYDKKCTKHIVATGISCGVDSLFTVDTYSNTMFQSKNINHLAFFDIGAFGTSKELASGRLNIAKNFAREYNYEFIYVVSNLHKVINKYTHYSHVCNNTYVACFCIFNLQYGFSAYYYSSGYSYAEFRLYDKYELDSEHYDLLLFNVFSVNELKFYSAGGSFLRIEKMEKIVKYVPSYKYLNVCVNTIYNCGKCFKCVRTLLSIDALGKIDDYKSVFDVNYYLENKDLYIRRMWIDGYLKRNSFYKEIIPYYKKELNFVFKMRCVFYILLNKVKRLLRLSVIEI